jgi:hypothetical protein
VALVFWRKFRLLKCNLRGQAYVTMNRSLPHLQMEAGSLGYGESSGPGPEQADNAVRHGRQVRSTAHT